MINFLLFEKFSYASCPNRILPLREQGGKMFHILSTLFSKLLFNVLHKFKLMFENLNSAPVRKIPYFQLIPPSADTTSMGKRKKEAKFFS